MVAPDVSGPSHPADGAPEAALPVPPHLQAGPGRTRRRLAAVLAADIVGYTRLMEEDEEGTYARLTELRAGLLDPSVREHRGHIVKNTGDGFLAVFDSAQQATHCALSMQRALSGLAAEAPRHRSISFRMGVNVADVIVEEQDVYGDGVNVAARLQTYAEPGGVVVSGAVAEQVGAEPGVRAVDMGELHLRNMARPVRAFSLTQRPVSSALGAAPAAPEGRPSIVVLPFRKHEPDRSDAYFVDGMIDDIIYALGGLKELFVISRGSTLGYGGSTIDVRAIGRELGVRYVLYGSIRRLNGRLRIGTELSDAESGAVVFSDQYDGQSSELFELQDRISKRVVTTIAPHVLERERLRAQRKHPQNLTAYDLVLQALAPLYQIDEASFARAHGLLQQAIAHDPSYAPAYSYAAYWHMIRIGQGWSPDPAADTAASARMAAGAVERDGNDALGLAIYGHMQSFLMKDYDRAVEYLDRALTAGPNCAVAWMMSSATCGYLGQGPTAVLRADHGLRLSPLDLHVFWHEHILSQAHYVNGNYDEALAWGERSARHNGKLTSNLRVVVASLVALGKTEQARAVARQLLALDPKFELATFSARTPLRGEMRDRFVERLRAAGLPDQR